MRAFRAEDHSGGRLRRAAACFIVVAVSLTTRAVHAQSGNPTAQAADPQDHSQHQMMDMPSSGWGFMQDGVAYGLFNHQGGPRGGDEFTMTSWWMGMLSRSMGSSSLDLTGMFSLDPVTAGVTGYGEIFQVGETADGRPLVDRQHPHDVFMQLSGAWRKPLGEQLWLAIAGGPSGEPALGPPAFMHRASAAAIPFAPLGHHAFDSTHISFGVVTAAVGSKRWTLEASAFNGREPDERRWDIDVGTLSSRSARLWFRPSSEWELQVSSGHLAGPEQLDPGDATRTTASATWLRHTRDGFAAAAFGYGTNAHEIRRSAFFGEGTWQRGRDTFSSRIEIVQVETSTLLGNHDPARVDALGALTLAAEHGLFRARGMDAAAGVNLTVYAVPAALRATHGSQPVSFQVFLSVRPLAASVHRMWNARMALPAH